MKLFGKRDPSQPPDPVSSQVIPISAALQVPVVEDSTLRERVLKEIDPAVAAKTPASLLRQQIEKIVDDIATESRLELTAREQQRVAEELVNDMTGYGPLEALLADDEVTDIMVNSPTKVYVERCGQLERSHIRFRDNQHIATVAQKVAAQVGRRIDDASPRVAE